MRNAFAVLACTILAAAPAAAQGPGATSEKTKLQALMDTNRKLTERWDATKKAEGQIARAELEVAGAERAWAAAERNFRRFGLKLKEQMSDIEREGVRSGCPFGSETTDRALYQSCNATADRLNAAMAEVIRKGEGQAAYAEKLAQERARLNKATKAAADKKRENNRIQREIEAEFVQWRELHHRFVFRSEAYEHLRRIAPEAENICAPASGTGHEGMRHAIHCLERLFELAPAR
jgi:hypothetical protein